MRVSLGDAGLPPCQDTSQASSIYCVVVPGVTKGTLTTADQGISNVVFGQVVSINQQAMDAYTANTQAAAASGGAVIASADPGAVPALSPMSPSAPSDAVATVETIPEVAIMAGIVAAVFLLVKIL